MFFHRSAAKALLLGLVSIGLLAAPSTAAVTYSVSTVTSSGGDPGAVFLGDLITIDITLRSDSELISALSASATGWDPNVVRFVSGVVTPSVLNPVCFPTNCFGGIENTVYPTPTLSNDSPLGPRVEFLNGINAVGATATGEYDLGVDGQFGGPQFRLVFELIGPGNTTIELGADPNYGDALILPGGLVGQSTNASVDIAWVPEPGSALLLGLGLAGLSRAAPGTKRRR